MNIAVVRPAIGLGIGAGIGAWAGATQAGKLGIPTVAAAITGMALGLIIAGTLVVWRILGARLGALTGAAATVLGAAISVAVFTMVVPQCPGREGVFANTGRCSVREVAVWALLAATITVATLALGATVVFAWRLPHHVRTWRRAWTTRQANRALSRAGGTGKRNAKPSRKAAAKPVAKTGAKPVAKPATKHTAKPAAKPAAKTGAKPAPAPPDAETVDHEGRAKQQPGRRHRQRTRCKRRTRTKH